MKKNLIFVTDQSIVKQKLNDFNQHVNVNQVDELTQHQYSHNSLLAFTKDWNLFLEFCQSRSVTALPASVTAVRQFLEFEARSRKLSTLRRYSVTISLIHLLLSQRDPTSNVLIRQTLSQLRLDKQGDAKQANSLDQRHLDELYQLLSRSKTTKLVRDLAVYFVMFECALKRGEVKTLQVTDLHTMLDPYRHWTVTVGSQTYSLSYRASRCLSRWLVHLSQQKGPLFRAIDRHGNVSASALDDSSLFRILRNAGQYLGNEQLKFSGQSTRIGAAKELASQGYKAKDIQEFGRWLSPAMPYQYIGDIHTAEQARLKFVSFKPWE